MTANEAMHQLKSDIDVLRELTTSVYLTPTQKAALGRLLGSAARAVRPRRATRHPYLPLHDVSEDDQAILQAIHLATSPRPRVSPAPALSAAELRAIADDPNEPLHRRADAEQALAHDESVAALLTEAEKERERIELLGPIGGGQ